MSAEHPNSTSPEDPAAYGIYPALDLTKQSIRLLAIDIESEDAIKCDLHVVDDLKDCPSFLAISYTWGPATPTKQITLNGFTIEVRENLYDLLTQLRRDVQGNGTQYVCRHDPPRRARNYKERQKIRQSMQYHTQWRYFWIDALCINQTNIDEKNGQVAMMSDIYYAANFVLVWLGPATNDSDTAMQVIDDLQLPKRTLFKLKQEGKETYLDAVRNLFQRPYWTRMWVVQEFIRAREVLLRCGNASSSITDLPANYNGQETDIFTNEPERTNFLSFECMVNDRQVYKVKEAPPLSDLMFDFAERKCFDVRDKVFALLGLAKLYDHPPPDYSRTVQQVFFDVVSREIKWLKMFSQINYDRTETVEEWEGFCSELANILEVDSATSKEYARLVWDLKSDSD